MNNYTIMRHIVINCDCDAVALYLTAFIEKAKKENLNDFDSILKWLLEKAEEPKNEQF
ncbi:MAG: hypothetical protein IKU37_08740 [Candidatus Gastranaerophilales bacterium]|nr:hypothetical protein [Candidatus Gastranaerophilales bacterium]